MPRVNGATRLEAFDLLQEFKGNNASRKEIVDKIHNNFGVPIGTLYDWYSNRHLPWGRKGQLTYNPELFYILGALLGDGCVYNWRATNNYIILIGDYNFAAKYARMVTRCTGVKTKAYIDRSKNIWFVRSNNFKLYSLFKKVRQDLSYLEQLIGKSSKKSALLFVEGFFDAEGCVKIIKEKVRKTPKICLDIANTNFKVLELIKRLLKDYLKIEARYSVQGEFVGKDGFRRQKTYHLRIYKKEYVQRFFKNVSTTKLKEEKIPYVENWVKVNLSS